VLVGEDGAQAAWLILHHAIANLPLSAGAVTPLGGHRPGRGARLLDALTKGDAPAALLRAAEALRADPDPARQRVHRLRVGLLLQELPRLRPVLPAGAHEPSAFAPDKVSSLPLTADVLSHLWPRSHDVWLSADGARVAVCGDADYEAEQIADRKAGRPASRFEVFDSRTGAPAGAVIDTAQRFRGRLSAFSPDGRRAVVAVTGAEGIRTWDVQTGKPLGPPLRPSWKRLDLPFDTRRALEFSPDGRWVVLREEIHYGERTAAWDPVTGKPLSLPEDYNQVWFSAGRRLALTGWNVLAQTRVNVRARAWDLRTGAQVGRALPVTDVRAAAFSPDGKRVVLGNSYWLGVWDLDTGRRAHPKIQVHRGAEQVTFRPDCKRFAAVAPEKDGALEARIYDARTGAALTPAMPVGGGFSQGARLRFTPDGMCLLTVTRFQARLWDAATGEPLTPALAGQGEFGGDPQSGNGFSAHLSPDGGKLFVRHSGATSQFEVRLLAPDDRPPAELLRLAQAVARRKVEASGKVVPLPPAELLSLRRALVAKAPEVFGAPVARAEDVRARRPDARVTRLTSTLPHATQPASLRKRAAERLGELKDRDALPALRAALKSDADGAVRAAAARALGAVGKDDRSLAAPLAAALRGDPEAAVRGAAAAALGEGAGKYAARELTESLRSEAEAWVRAVSASALRLAGPRDAEALAALRAALKDPDLRVRVEAAAVLAHLTPEAREPLEVLCAALAEPRETWARTLAIRYVAELGPRAKDAAPALLALLRQRKIPRGAQNETSDLLNALGRIGPAGEGVLEALLARLPEDGGNIYQSWDNPVARAVVRYGPTAVPQLVRLFKEGKTLRARRCAAIALGYLGPAAKEAVPILEPVWQRLQEKEEKTEEERWLENTLRPALERIRPTAGRK
jgi:HEAT repeat protein